MIWKYEETFQNILLIENNLHSIYKYSIFILKNAHALTQVEN